MTRFCLTIGQTSLNLPPSQTCKLRFVIKADTSFPNYTSQAFLNKKQTRLYLNQQIVFTIPSLEDQQAISVYIVGITSNHVIHLGMFIIDLNQDEEGRKKVEGCVGQEGVVSFCLVANHQSDKKINVQINNSVSEVQESSRNSMQQTMSYNSRQNSNARQTHQNEDLETDYYILLKQFEEYKKQKESQIQVLEITNSQIRKQLEYMQEIHEELIEQHRGVKNKMQDYQSLNSKLSQLYEKLVNQNIELRNRAEEDNSRRSNLCSESEQSDVVSIKISTKNRFCQTENQDINNSLESKLQQELNQIMNNVPPKIVNWTQCYSQTEIQEQSKQQDLTIYNSISLQNQRIELMSYLSKIQQLQLDQMKHEIEQSKLQQYTHSKSITDNMLVNPKPQTNGYHASFSNSSSSNS